MLVIHRRSSLRLHSSVAGLVLALAAGCSAPPGTDSDDEPTVPPFGTGINANQPATANTSNMSANGAGGNSNASNPGRTGEGNPGVQVNNGNMMPAGTNPATGSAGAGGAPATMTGMGTPMMPVNSGGAAGSNNTPPPVMGVAGAGPQGGAGSGSMPPPPPAASGCGTGALFCETFDARPLGALQAGTNNLAPERSVTIIDDPQRGRVLQASATSGFDGRAGFFLNNFAAPGNSYFGRMFVRVAQFPTAAEFAHWVIVEATGPDRAELVRPVGGQLINRGGLRNFWAPGSDRGPAGDWTDHQASEAVGANGTWACVQWEMDAADGSAMSVTVDGEAVPRMAHNGFGFPMVNRLWFGWVVFQANTQPNAFDVRFDDILLSSQPVGCN